MEPLRDMFSAIFFVAIGLLLDPKVLVEYAWPITVISVAVVLGKILACSLGTLIAGNDGRTSLRVGMGRPAAAHVSTATAHKAGQRHRNATNRHRLQTVVG